MNPVRPSHRLRVWTRFLATPADVWSLKTDPARLRSELWPLRLEIDDEPGLVAAFASSQPGRFEGRLSPLGVDWPVDLVEVTPRQRFVDRSENSLFDCFEHRHLFEPTADGTRYVDDLLLRPAGPLPRLTIDLTVRTFQRRHRRAARHLPNDPRATAVCVLRQILPDEPVPA